MEVIALTLGRGLRDRGHEVTFVVNGWNDGDFLARLAAAELPAEQIFLGKLSKSLRPRAIKWTVDCLVHLPGARRAVRRHFSNFRPHVVLISHRDWILMLRSLLKRERSIFHVHELPNDSWWARTSYRRIDRTVDGFAAVSENIARRLVGLGVRPENTYVVQNGIAFNEATPRASRTAGVHPPTIGIVGQIGDWKGHGELLGALQILHKADIEWRCAIFGRGDAAYVASLKQIALNYGIADDITWEGYVSNTDIIYQGLDICVVPSNFDDPFPTVAIEASLRGIPVIASRRGGLPEIVVDGETGCLVESGDVGELARRLGELLQDAALRQRLGQAARARALQRFTAARMAQDMESVLNSVAEVDR